MGKQRTKVSAKNSDGAQSSDDDRPPEIDVTDYRIISLLRKNGRMPSRDLANALGHTETTLRARLRKLDTSDTMRVVAMTDFRAAGFNLMSSIGVQVKGRPAVDVAEEIAKLPQILNVQIVIGTADIELSAGASDAEALAKLIYTLGAIPGVHRLMPGMALEVIKFQWGWVPFL
jgi:Lrp/AsnC family transcriptional regulator for asnA, asnC and gidA